MKKAIIAAALVSMLSACGNTPSDNKDTATDLSQQVIDGDTASAQPFSVHTNPPSVPFAEGGQVVFTGHNQPPEQEEATCNSISIKNGKTFCKFIPSWHANSIPSPAGQNQIPFEEKECKNLTSTSMLGEAGILITCKFK